MPSSELLKDLAFALRSFRRRPLFTASALAILALAIGSATAVFSLVNGVLLRPLPYTDPGRLVMVSGSDPDGTFPVSENERLYYRAATDVFATIGTWYLDEATVLTGGDPEQLPAAYVDARTFPAAGISAALGRIFADAEEVAGASPTVVLSWGYWHDRLASDPRILGRTITINGHATVVIGVLPPEVRLPDDFAGTGARLYLPVAIGSNPDPRNIHYLSALARLRPGVSPGERAARLGAIGRELTEALPSLPRRFSVRTVGVEDAIFGPYRGGVAMLLTAVGLLVVLASVNIAGLLLANAERRHREFAVRAALGAGGDRLHRQMLTESLLLGAVGGLLGVAVAWVAVRGLLAVSPPDLPRVSAVTIDPAVLLFTTLLTLGTAVLFGLAPARTVRHRDLHGALRTESRSATAGPRAPTLRRALVLAEIALAVTIGGAAGFIVRSWLAVVRSDPGFEPGGTITLQLSLPDAQYATREARWRYFAAARDELTRLPGVQAAGAVNLLPLAMEAGDWGFLIEGRAVPQDERHPFADRFVVTPGYFEAMRIPLREGRLLNTGDVASQVPVVLVNEAVARRYWPGGGAVGARIMLSTNMDPVWRTIVGVVGNIRSRGLEAGVRQEFYFPHAQFPAQESASAAGTMSFVVRSDADPAAVVAPARAALRSLDPGVPVSQVRTMNAVLDSTLSVRRFQLMVLGFFAAAALALVAMGVYGVVASVTGERTREFGVRMALGADRRGILRLVLGDAVRLGLGGMAIGTAGALAAGRLVRGSLYGVGPADPAVLIVVPLVVFVVVVGATLSPAIRAAGVDPAVTLKSE